jgi:phosphoribosyl-ATP pyrophosphohydrolase
MIIPSIDLAGGRVVQLIGGRELALEAGDPLPWLERFRLAGEVAVVDLDAAMGTGDQREPIRALCREGACRVGGGIRDYDRARFWLDAGASRIVIGTAAGPDLLRRLPRDRVIVALDARHGEVVVHGWQTATGRDVASRMRELREYCGGFLVTFVEREGRLGGTDLDRARELVRVAGDARLTVAGGVRTAQEIAELDRLGADAQVGMALYTGRLDLGEAIAAPCTSDRDDGLLPTVVTDERGLALGLAWSSRDSLRAAVSERRGIYHSRRRGRWIKGEASGNHQELLAVALDCDRDAMRFTVRQHGTGFCHQDTLTCWGDGHGLARLERIIAARRAGGAVAGSYTQRLLDDPDLLAAKVIEEAGELSAADTPDAVVEETADLLYFAMARLAAAGLRLADVEAVLERRARVVTRRPGDAKRAASREVA